MHEFTLKIWNVNPVPDIQLKTRKQKIEQTKEKKGNKKHTQKMGEKSNMKMNVPKG